MKEQYLIHQISEGNKKAFEELYLLFKDKVYNTAICYLQNSEDAEEVTQDVFLSIFYKADTFKGNSSVSTWVYKMTINKAINQINKAKRIPNSKYELKEHHRIDFKHPGIILENQEKATYLFTAINELDESQKTTFILTYIEGLPQLEVAAIMENTVKSVESLLQRAKTNLRKKIISMYPEGK